MPSDVSFRPSRNAVFSTISLTSDESASTAQGRAITVDDGARYKWPLQYAFHLFEHGPVVTEIIAQGAHLIEVDPAENRGHPP